VKYSKEGGKGRGSQNPSPTRESDTSEEREVLAIGFSSKNRGEYFDDVDTRRGLERIYSTAQTIIHVPYNDSTPAATPRCFGRESNGQRLSR
jgi:hypothetical protein